MVKNDCCLVVGVAKIRGEVQCAELMESGGRGRPCGTPHPPLACPSENPEASGGKVGRRSALPCNMDCSGIPVRFQAAARPAPLPHHHHHSKNSMMPPATPPPPVISFIAASAFST